MIRPPFELCRQQVPIILPTVLPSTVSPTHSLFPVSSSPRRSAPVAALKHNDGVDDYGIEVCFSFASPTNRAATGPLERFSNMVKKGYPELVNCREYVVHDGAVPEVTPAGPLPGVGVGVADPSTSRRTFLVSVSTADGGRHLFAWHLSRQSKEPLVGAWMADGVQQLS